MNKRSKLTGNVVKTGPFEIRFPQEAVLNQDEEWCEVKIDGTWKVIRFHDYRDVFAIPGLYETLFYRTLRCVSPTEVISLFRQVFTEDGKEEAENLRVLDVGAGNGMAGEALHTMGIKDIVGVDIIPEAKKATERDRPWVYNEYFITDLSVNHSDDMKILKQKRFNALVTVAALGFGDIPNKAFFNAFNLILDDGWIAFNIKEDFLKGSNISGFSGLIQKMWQNDILRIEMYRRYRHRLSINGEDLYYIAFVGRKLNDIPEHFLDEAPASH